MRPKLVAGIFFGFLFFYVSLSPFSISGMGYELENMKACGQLFHNLMHLLGLAPTPVNLSIPRHGLLEVLLQMPLYSLARLLGGSDLLVDRILSIHPAIETASICAILFVWIQNVTGSIRWAYVLTIAAGLATMLWPYAYIGLETSQSLFLLIAGHLALSSKRITTKRTVALVIASAFAVGLKTVGIFLVPAVALLGFAYFRNLSARRRVTWLAAFGSLIVLSCAACHILAGYSSMIVRSGGSTALARSIAVPPTAVPFNIISMIASPNKGLIVYCPILILAILGARTAYKQDPFITSFGFLVLGGIAVGLSCTIFWADEVWGPRYLHSAVPPLIMVMAAARGRSEFRWRKQVGVAIFMAVGLAVSFLGSFFSYHTLHEVGTQAESVTLETLQYSPHWNPVRFDAQLLRVWMHRAVFGDSYDHTWPAMSHEWSGVVGIRDIAQPVSLRSFAVPQPFLFRQWPGWNYRPELLMWIGAALSLVGGLVLLGRGCHRCLIVGHTRDAVGEPASKTLRANGTWSIEGTLKSEVGPNARGRGSSPDFATAPQGSHQDGS